MTYADLIKLSLQKIGILAEGEAASAEQGADAMLVFAAMIDELRGEGLNIAAPQTSTTDEPDIPEGYMKFTQCLLAVNLAAHFEVPTQEIPVDVFEAVTSGYNRLRRENIYREAVSRTFGHTPFQNLRNANIENG